VWIGTIILYHSMLRCDARRMVAVQSTRKLLLHHKIFSSLFLNVGASTCCCKQHNIEPKRVMAHNFEVLTLYSMRSRSPAKSFLLCSEYHRTGDIRGNDKTVTVKSMSRTKSFVARLAIVQRTDLLADAVHADRLQASQLGHGFQKTAVVVG
jgi:hypothetical protein